MKFRTKEILCPKCKRKIATWDGVSSANIEVLCRKCNKLAVFRPINETVELREVPKRNTASGMRFL